MQSSNDSIETLHELIQRLGMPPEDVVERWCHQLENDLDQLPSNFGKPLDLCDFTVSLDGNLHLQLSDRIDPDSPISWAGQPVNSCQLEGSCNPKGSANPDRSMESSSVEQLFERLQQKIKSPRFDLQESPISRPQKRKNRSKGRSLMAPMRRLFQGPRMLRKTSIVFTLLGGGLAGWWFWRPPPREVDLSPHSQTSPPNSGDDLISIKQLPIEQLETDLLKTDFASQPELNPFDLDSSQPPSIDPLAAETLLSLNIPDQMGQDRSQSQSKTILQQWLNEPIDEDSSSGELETTSDALEVASDTLHSSAIPIKPKQQEGYPADIDRVGNLEVIVVDAIPIHFNDLDQTYRWVLSEPVQGSRADLKFRLDLGDSISPNWLQSFNFDSIRRSRGLLVLTPADSIKPNPQDDQTLPPGPGIAIRMDIRIKRSIDVRLRMAVRAHERMPWQATTKEQLDQYAANLASQAIRLDQMLAQISTVYSQAKSAEKAKLRTRRETIKQASRQTEIASQQVVQLQALMDDVESSVQIHLELHNNQKVVFMTRESP